MSPPTGLAKSLALANQTALSHTKQGSESSRAAILQMWRFNEFVQRSHDAKPRTCPKDFTGFEKLLILGTLKPKTDTRTS